LGDISPNFFKGEQLSIIKDFVENKGGSLIFLAGKDSFGEGGFGESIIKDMLPIEIGKDGAKLINSPFNPVLTQIGLNHPSTRLSDDPTENKAIWRDLPSLNHFYTGVGTRSGATVLAEHQQEKGKPLIAFQRYGKGITYMIASDDLWQWAFVTYAQGGDDSYYRKFWSGTIRWLSFIRIQAEQVNVEPSKQTYTKDEKAIIKAYIYNENYDPIDNAQIKAQVQTPAGTSKDIRFVFEENGRYSAEFAPTMDGNHKVEVMAEYNGRLIGKGTAEFIVQTATLEYQSIQLNEPLLKQIADISGGKYYNINDINELSKSIKSDQESIILTKEQSVWDNGWLLGFVVIMLTTEWLLRKKKGLV
ncbi:MAG: glutamine amidotransferase, partial [Candidatus Poribacteria bacterium]